LDSFSCRDKTIRVEWFNLPASTKHCSSVLLFPGNGALSEEEDDFYRIFGRYLAGHGVRSCLVRYFDFHGLKNGDYVREPERLADYISVVVSAIDYAVTFSGQRHIAVFGHSFGSGIGLCCLDCPNIGCFIDLSGSLPFEMPDSIKSLPPLLILHGDKDTVVPFEATQALLDAWHARKCLVEMHVYKDQGHTLHDASYTDVMERSLHFIKKVMCE
jgi:predicted esterase